MKRLAIAGVVVALSAGVGGVALADHEHTPHVRLQMGERVIVTGFKSEDQAKINYRASGKVVVKRVHP